MTWTVILVPISVILVFIARRWPHVVEVFYSSVLYRYISQPLSHLTGIFPFSLGEMLFYSFILLTLICIFRIIVLLFSKNIKPIADLLKTIVFVFSILLFLFVTMWGLNYYRLPLSESMAIKIGSLSIVGVGILWNTFPFF